MTNIGQIRHAIQLRTWTPDLGASEEDVARLVNDFRQEIEKTIGVEDILDVDRDSLFAQAHEDGSCIPGDMLFLDRYLVLVRNYRRAMQGLRDTAEKLRKP